MRLAFFVIENRRKNFGQRLPGGKRVTAGFANTFCCKGFRFFRGIGKNEEHQRKDEKNNILKGKPRVPPVVPPGVSTAGRHLVLYCRKNRLGYNRLGLTVSAKLAGAVQRNRVKRLFREAYRLHEDEFASGVDLVLVARSRAVGATYWEIEKSLLRALKENKAAAAQF